jgi:hypothetical protein
MTVPEELQVEVFRVGDYGLKGSYTEQDLDAMATDYNPREHEAPVTLDHDQKGPAHGWVSGLKRLGDRLVATITRLSPSLAAALETQAFKKRSVELYRQNPKTGRPYLKAVSFLGAAPPEVKGLNDPVFTEEDQETILFEECPTPTITFAQQAKEALIRNKTWNPEWDGMGLLDVFTALGDGDQSNALLKILSTIAKPVSFGETPRSKQSSHHQFSDNLSGGNSSPESEQRHLRALERLNADPTLSYRDALLLS